MMNEPDKAMLVCEKKSRILVVDDTPDNLRLLMSILSKQGYMAHPANSGKAALRFVESTIPDLILLDVMMPDMNGYQVCERLKEDKATCDIPVIFVSAADQAFDKVKAFAAGGIDYIVKPFQPEEVLMRMNIHLSLRREIEERKRALLLLQTTQQQLLQSEKMASIGRLAAGVAHEINNPIGYVSSNLTSLGKYVSDLLVFLTACEQAQVHAVQNGGDVTRELNKRLNIEFIRTDVLALLHESREGIGRVQTIVQSLKYFSHVDSPVDWQLADIHRGLDCTLNIIDNEVRNKASVHKEYANIPHIACVASQLNQVFLNLLVNAAQAMDDKGEIWIRTGQSDDQIWIEIADNGKGIAPEHMSRIFDPFFTTKPIGKGTGLGLSLSHGIIQKHHGRIEVTSELNKGSEFRIWLPIKHTAED